MDRRVVVEKDFNHKDSWAREREFQICGSPGSSTSGTHKKMPILLHRGNGDLAMRFLSLTKVRAWIEWDSVSILDNLEAFHIIPYSG